jgi:hypothetical protein
LHRQADDIVAEMLAEFQFFPDVLTAARVGSAMCVVLGRRDVVPFAGAAELLAAPAGLACAVSS